MATTNLKGINIPEEWLKINPDLEQNLETMLTGTRKKRAHVPRGYVQVEDSADCEPVPELLLEYVQLLIDGRVNNSRSLREFQDVIFNLEKKHGIEDPNPISLGGISQLFDRIERDLGIYQKETNRDAAQKRRVERLRKAKAEQKSRTYNYSREQQAKVEVQKRLTKANRDLETLKKREKALKAQAARNARKLELQKDPTKYKESAEDPSKLEYVESSSKKSPEIIVPSADIVADYQKGLAAGWDEHLLMEIYRDIRKHGETYNGRMIGFLPTPRQYMFMSAPEDIVLYGGAAGGGKSYAMVMDAVRHAHHSHYKAVIIRRTVKELGELIDNSLELYRMLYPTAKWNSTEKVWRFPSGAQIFFSYLDNPNDKLNYQGHQYQYVGFDELSQHVTAEGFNYLITRMRDPKEKIHPVMRATANPGSMWVYEMFIKDKEPNVPFILPHTKGTDHEKTVRFIPAKLEDNPHLDDNGIYRGNLLASGGILAKQLLEGNWLASVDNMFPEFNPEIHIVDPFFVPRHWNRVAGLDYGYRDPSAAVWFAVDPEDNTLIVYDEFLQSGLTGREFSLAISEREQEELVMVDHPIDWSVWARTGHTGPTIAESMLSVPNFRLRRADKNREAGWVQIHEHLRPDPRTGAPKIKIFSSCKQLIKQIMSAKVHKSKPNDLDDTRNADGHWDLLDALRYGVMSRPRRETLNDELNRIKQVNHWDRVNKYFS